MSAVAHVSSDTAVRASRNYVVWLLAAAFVAAFTMIYLIPPSSQILFVAFAQVRETGFYPDGLPVRRQYTGVYLLDEMFTGLAGLFSAASDGRDPATHLFCLWFLPQLCGVLVFIYWEAGKAETFSIIQFPTFFGILAQLIAAGPTLPLYFIAHIYYMPMNASKLPSDGLARARTLLPAITIGYLLPSAVLFLAPTTMSLDAKQIVAAIWQPFPLYISLLNALFRCVDTFLFPATAPPPESVTNGTQKALHWIKRSYQASALLSAIAHWATAIPALLSSDPSTSFAHVFVPYILHPYFPYHITASTVPPYRQTIRLLFQHDWLFMTVAAFIFFGWHHFSIMSGEQGIRSSGWIRNMLLCTVAGGPGTAFAWAAIRRENEMLKMQQNSKAAYSAARAEKL
ncbi:hypothetical protein BDW22DRAFT_1430626 [Trametopsis cervina]|nr:hypothetical protein BDW22DRAFT_1430626 [Trametopsis cervina]